jgi:phenylpropionate dioxygenase-like ring-hydroxylating dioxygenase large terminal subunit
MISTLSSLKQIQPKAIKSKLSQYAGIGARRVSSSPSATPPPTDLPKGHPYLGVRNTWYLICTSSELGDQPVARRLLGEDLVLWRTTDGAPRLMADYCPHRGARLSVGDVVDGEIQCRYHFWRYDADGQCTSIPTQGGKCSLQSRTKIEAIYPTAERSGYIWAWIGDSEPGELVLPIELTDPSYSSFPESVEWGVNWLLALENLADIMHAPFLHNQSLTLGGGIVEDRVNVDDHETGFRVERQNQKGLNFDWVEFELGDLIYSRLDIPYRASFAGPGPDLRILGFATPIDDAHTMVHFPRCRQVTGWKRTLWRLLYNLRLRGTHLHVLNQDKEMLESMRTIPEAQRDEHLAQADKPVLHLRRKLRPLFDAQIAELGPEWEGTAGLSGTKSVPVEVQR